MTYHRLLSTVNFRRMTRIVNLACPKDCYTSKHIFELGEEVYSNKADKLVRILKPYTEHLEKSKEFSLDIGNMWKCLVEQVCVRGGSKPIDLLEKRGDKEKFHSQLSLNKMPLSYDEILKALTNFKATRFRLSASKTIIENYHRSFSNGEFKFISLFKADFSRKELAKERIEAERKLRKELRERSVFVWIFRRGNEFKTYGWKNKPLSDWLKDIDFAVTLMPFDSKVKKILKELGLKLTDGNYENIENFLIEQVCVKLGILPSQLDRIFYNNSDKIIESLKAG